MKGANMTEGQGKQMGQFMSYLFSIALRLNANPRAMLELGVDSNAHDQIVSTLGHLLQELKSKREAENLERNSNENS